MKITLTDIDAKKLEISDESFQVPGFVELNIGQETIDLHITDLMPAFIAFDAKYSKMKETDKSQIMQERTK